MAEKGKGTHTPGPWKVDDQRDKDGRVVARHVVAREPLGNLDAPVCKMYPCANGDDDAPNAALIASAPALAARVEELEGLLKRWMLVYDNGEAMGRIYLDTDEALSPKGGA